VTLRGAELSATVVAAPVRRAAFIRLAPAAAALAAAGAVAVGAIAVPDVAGALSDATDSLGPWVYVAVAAVVFLETTVLAGFLIHGELALLVGGVAAERGDASLPGVVALAWLAAVAGDSVSLRLGRRLGRPFLARHAARFGRERLARVEGFFARHGGKALLLGRFTGFTRAVLPFVAGSSGFPLRRLLPISAASGLVWTATFTTLGYAFSESFADAGETASQVAFVAVLVAAAVFAAGAWLR
jgi:membrane protein DedA with SNARE-associated domain